MRVLMISDFYFPYLGGVEQHVRSLSRALVARGHDVAIATLQANGLAAREDDGGIRVHRMHMTMQRSERLFKNAERTWAPPFADPEAMAALRAIVAAERPEIVHGHDWLARSFVPLKPWSGAKFVVSLHYYTASCAKKDLMYLGAEPCSGPAPLKCMHCSRQHYGAMKALPIVLGNWGMGFAEERVVDTYIAVSQATADGNRLADSGAPYTVIPNFVQDDLGAVQRRGEDDVEQYVRQLPAEEFLLFVGDLRRLKGLDVLLEAYAGLTGAPPLVLIGKVWDETPKHFPPNVWVFKKWPNYAIMAAWQRAMIAVAPSIWPEPFGIVIIEAMAAAKPVVASAIGGIPDIVVHGETGILTPPNDAHALRRALECLVASPELRQAMGCAGQRRVAQFHTSAVVPRIEQLYGSLL